MNKEQRQLLEAPFAPDLIKTRPGTFGATLSYVETHCVVRRLNEVFEASWSFTILQHEVLDNEVLVLGRLTVEEEVIKEQFGCSAITKNRESGEFVSLANDLKAASSDSLKRCAMLLGIGLQLYGKDSGTASRNKGADSNNKYGDSGTNHTSTNGQSTTHHDTTPHATNQTTRISSKQHQFLIKLARERNWSKQDLNQKSIEGYGSGIAHLNKQQASEFIASMLDN